MASTTPAICTIPVFVQSKRVPYHSNHQRDLKKLHQTRVRCLSKNERHKCTGVSIKVLQLPSRPDATSRSRTREKTRMSHKHNQHSLVECTTKHRVHRIQTLSGGRGPETSSSTTHASQSRRVFQCSCMITRRPLLTAAAVSKQKFAPMLCPHRGPKTTLHPRIVSRLVPRIRRIHNTTTSLLAYIRIPAMDAAAG